VQCRDWSPAGLQGQHKLREMKVIPPPPAHNNRVFIRCRDKRDCVYDPTTCTTLCDELAHSTALHIRTCSTCSTHFVSHPSARVRTAECRVLAVIETLPFSLPPNNLSDSPLQTPRRFCSLLTHALGHIRNTCTCAACALLHPSLP
jgi:hypothetical protein